MNLYNAATQGHTKKVKKLLMAGVPCDWQAPSGYTPLTMAAAKGHHEVVELLIAKGARVNQGVVVGKTAVYRTPLLLGVELGCLKVVQLLLAKGADIHQSQENG